MSETTRAIGDRALDVFESRGYDATGVDELAAAAGVSRRTFFRHFHGKDDAVLQAHDRRRDAVLADLARTRGPAVTAVLGAVRSSVDGILADPEPYRRRYRLVFGVPELHRRMRGTDLDYEEAAAQLLARDFPPGSPAPAMIAAAALAAVNTVLRALAEDVDVPTCRSLLDTGLDHLARLAGALADRPRRTVVVLAETDLSTDELTAALRAVLPTTGSEIDRDR